MNGVEAMSNSTINIHRLIMICILFASVPELISKYLLIKHVSNNMNVSDWMKLKHCYIFYSRSYRS